MGRKSSSCWKEISHFSYWITELCLTFIKPLYCG
jgi:hypothetical protein